MDDFVISNLHEARNEWCTRLVSILTPLVEQGLRSIFDEAWNMCVNTDEMNKYLMTFQNLISRIPKWNSVIIEDERKRIIERSGCNYLEDLITCVHIIQLKVLTCIRVGNKQKKIDISIPHNLEICWGMLRPKSEQLMQVKEIIVASFYSPPKSRKKSKLLDHILTTLHVLLTKYPRAGIIIGADRNDLNISSLLVGLPRVRQIVTEYTY